MEPNNNLLNDIQRIQDKLEELQTQQGRTDAKYRGRTWTKVPVFGHLAIGLSNLFDAVAMKLKGSVKSKQPKNQGNYIEKSFEKKVKMLKNFSKEQNLLVISILHSFVKIYKKYK